MNFSDSDLAIQLHFALFNGSFGYVLKPAEMLGFWTGNVASFSDQQSRRSSVALESARSSLSSARSSAATPCNINLALGPSTPRRLTNENRSCEVSIFDRITRDHGDRVDSARQNCINFGDTARSGSVNLSRRSSCSSSISMSRRTSSGTVQGAARASCHEAVDDDAAYWPPPRANLQRTTIKLFSLHVLPKVRA